MSLIDNLIATMNCKLTEAGLPQLHDLHPQVPDLTVPADEQRKAADAAQALGRCSKMLAAANDHRCVTVEHLLLPLFTHRADAVAALMAHINATIPSAQPDDFLLTSHAFTGVIQRIRDGLPLLEAVRAEGPDSFSAKLLDRYRVY